MQAQRTVPRTFNLALEDALTRSAELVRLVDALYADCANGEWAGSGHMYWAREFARDVSLRLHQAATAED